MPASKDKKIKKASLVNKACAYIKLNKQATKYRHQSLPFHNCGTIKNLTVYFSIAIARVLHPHELNSMVTFD